MKVGIDLRLTEKTNIYSEFLKILVETLLKTDRNSSYIIYSNTKLDIDLSNNSENKIINEKPGSFEEQLLLNKKFNKEQFSLMIFFNHEKPIFYNKNFIIIIPSLVELFFTTKNLFGKLKYNLLLNTSLKNCKRVICFDKNTATELNERLNIKEDLIKVLHPFFITEERYKIVNNLKVDIKAKYNLKFDYFIYDGNNKPNANLTKLFKVLIALKKKDIHINLLILSKEPSNDIELREEVIDYNIQDRVFFIGEIDKNEESNYYKQSIGVIYPSIYDSFPFRLSKAIKYNTPIIAGNIPTIKEFILDKINTFNPLSATDFINTVEPFLEKSNKITYTKTKINFSKEKTTDKLIDLIYENIYSSI